MKTHEGAGRKSTGEHSDETEDQRWRGISENRGNQAQKRESSTQGKETGEVEACSSRSGANQALKGFELWRNSDGFKRADQSWETGCHGPRNQGDPFRGFLNGEEMRDGRHMKTELCLQRRCTWMGICSPLCP